MSGESSHPSKDPVRIVYHSENRTFARLFTEHTLDQLKDVVRRKLGLGRDTDVSLKQMGPGPLLDLDDDDDFQAFRVLLRSCVSADIQVTVDRPLDPPVRTRASAAFEEDPLRVRSPETVPPVTSSSSQSKALARSSTRPEASRTTEELPSHPKESTRTAADLSSTPPEAARPPEAVKQLMAQSAPPDALSSRPKELAKSSATAASEPTEAALSIKNVTATKKTPGPSARKRKVSFDETAAAKTPVTPKPLPTEEPPKKKQKKETVKTKDVRPAEDVGSSSKKASTLKSKANKPAALDNGNEVGTSAPKDPEASKPTAKKPRKHSKDDSTVPHKSSPPANPDGADQPINRPVNLANDTPLQPERTLVARSSVGGISNTRQSEKKIGACAAIPRTNASTTVQSEVAAAILSGLLAKPSEIVVPTPPAKRKSVKKDTKKSTASSSALLATSTAVSYGANGAPSVRLEQRPEPVVPTNEPPPQTRGSNGPLCPICEEEPFHIRYCCPTVLKGPDAIRDRLEQVKRTNAGDQQSLVKELEGLLRDSKVTSQPSLDATPTHSRDASQPLKASISRTAKIPNDSNMSEVTVENRDEGSSSESSDDVVEETSKESPAPEKQKMSGKPPLLSNDDLEAVIRGPKRHSILSVLDRIVDDDDDKNSNSDSDSEEDQVQDELEDEDADEDIERSRRWLSKHAQSSDSESGSEQSGSPSSSRSVKDTMRAGPNNSPEESTERQDDDVVMKDNVVPAVLAGQGDDSSEETHIGSEDRMAAIGAKGAVVIVGEQLSSPPHRTSALLPSNASRQEFGQTEVDPTSNQDNGTLRNEAEADPIEPADDLEPRTHSRSSNTDSIEAPPEDVGLLSTGITQSAPNPGVTKRIKNRHGQILDDDAEQPILVEQLTSATTGEVTPLPTKGKSRRKVTEKSSGQEPASTRRSPRFSSLPPSTSAPAAVALLNHRTKVGVRSTKAVQTPAKRSEQRADASQSSAKEDSARNGACLAPTPSLVRWETLATPLSSSPLQLDEPSLHVDELRSSSPQPDDEAILGRANVKDKRNRRKPLSDDAESAQEQERLFDPSSSQIPFPYSQHKNAATPMAFPNANGKERGEETVIPDSEVEGTVKKKRAKSSVRYRSLSQLASQATIFSPSLPTPATKSATNGKTKKRVTAKESSSSSSSDEEEEGNGSEHIPRGRRAGSVLETKKRKSLLSRHF